MEDLETITNQIHCLIEQQHQQKQEALQKELIQGIEQMEAMAESINALAVKLEMEMLQFTKIACKVNQVYHTMQQPTKSQANKSINLKLPQCRPLNLWQVHDALIPYVVRKHSKFILTVRTVNLFSIKP